MTTSWLVNDTTPILGRQSSQHGLQSTLGQASQSHLVACSLHAPGRWASCVSTLSIGAEQLVQLQPVEQWREFISRADTNSPRPRSTHSTQHKVTLL